MPNQDDMQLKVEKLYLQLKKIQEAKGFFFNSQQSMTNDLLEQLITTKERYGYMACPCRLANGKYEFDKDIICPCVYREADVKEFGECFCGLYMSKERLADSTESIAVPDRRPPEKIVF